MRCGARLRSAVCSPDRGVGRAAARAGRAARCPSCSSARRRAGRRGLLRARAETTRFAQPAIFFSSLAALLELEAPRGGRVRRATRSASSGARRRRGADAEDGLRAGRARAAADGRVRAPSGDGRMLALLRGTPEMAAEWRGGRRRGRQRQRPGQIVLAGAARGAAPRRRDRRASAACARWRSTSPAPSTRRGWRRRRSRSARALDARRAARARGHGVLGATAAPFTDIREELARRADGPVRWRETMAAIAAHGADTFIDVGPDQVLARLVPRNVERGRERDRARGAAVSAEPRV